MSIEALLIIEAKRISLFKQKFQLTGESTADKMTMLLLAFSIDKGLELNSIEMLIYFDKVNFSPVVLNEFLKRVSIEDLPDLFFLIFPSMLKFSNESEQRMFIVQFSNMAEKCPSLEILRNVSSIFKLLNERPQFLFPNGSKFSTGASYELESKVREIIKRNIYFDKKFKLVKMDEKILILFGHAQPLNNIGSHWRQLATYAKGFASLGYSVDIVVTNEDTTNLSYVKTNLHALPKNWRTILQEQLIEIIGVDCIEKVALKLFNPHEDRDYFSKVSDAVSKSGALISFVWQGFFTSDLFVGLAKKVSPIAAIEFQAGNPRIEIADYCFIQGKIANRKITESNFLEAPIPLVPQENKHTWDNKNICQSGSKVIVTVLGNGRIERAFNDFYDEEFLSKLLDIVDGLGNIEWHLVGVRDNLLNQESKDFFRKAGIFKLLDYVDDLRSYYNQCDYYVHLPTLGGGGWGVALAAFENLPILYQMGGDSDNFLIEEFLYEPGRFLDAFEEMVRCDEMKCISLVAKQNSLLKKHTPENAARALISPFLKYGRV